jgi:hypothetical protein
VDDGSKRAVINADRGGVSDDRWTPAAARTTRQRKTDDAPRRQRIAAAITEWRR